MTALSSTRYASTQFENAIFLRVPTEPSSQPIQLDFPIQLPRGQIFDYVNTSHQVSNI